MIPIPMPNTNTPMNRIRVAPANPPLVARMRDPRLARVVHQQQQQQEQQQQQQNTQMHQQQQHQLAMMQHQQQATYNAAAMSSLPPNPVPIDPQTSNQQHDQILAELDIGTKDIREQKQRIAHKTLPVRAPQSNARNASNKAVPNTNSTARSKSSARASAKTSAKSSSIRDRSERSSRSDSKSGSNARRSSSEGNSDRKKTRTNSTSGSKGEAKSPKRSTSDAKASNSDASASPTKNARVKSSLAEKYSSYLQRNRDNGSPNAIVSADAKEEFAAESTAADEKSKDNPTDYFESNRADITQQHQLLLDYRTHLSNAFAIPLVVFPLVDRLICLFIRMKLDSLPLGTNPKLLL